MFKIWISFYLLISRFFRGKKKKKTVPFQVTTFASNRANCALTMLLGNTLIPDFVIKNS